jgi:2-iminobutanoate/2-iminopropanoate deaminase
MRYAAILTLLFLAQAGCVMIDSPRQAPQTAESSPGKDIVLPGNRLFSAAVRHGDTLYLSGIIGRSETGDVTEATREAMDGVEARLQASGRTMADLLKCTVYLTDMTHYGEMNAAYADYFASDPPARTAIAVAALPFEALVEVTCVAAAR